MNYSKLMTGSVHGMWVAHVAQEPNEELPKLKEVGTFCWVKL